ncbi:metallophosphoesterase family protein [Candidatus Lokiarchaeum ossiferum]|uniref:metallophosphoesterase family protein n=1 Tax=Candidatus Lokiarchaeum ossiferum TaxID=2951803 RepID=UPI00352EE8EE
MDVGILSDSHLTDENMGGSSYKTFFHTLQSLFHEVDHIIHAGDITSPRFLEDLSKIAPVSYIRGNMDYEHPKWPRKLLLNFEGVSIGVVHRIEDIGYFDPIPQVIIYGHTHIAEIKESKMGCLLINPGSVTQPRPRSRIRNFLEETELKPSVGILSLNEGLISAFIKQF